MGDGVTLELAGPGGQGLALHWRADDLARLDLGGDEAPVWSLGGELDWDQVASLRIVSGRLDDETVVAVAALRPAAAAGHGEEIVAGALGAPGELTALSETLLSSESGPDGALRRIGLELYRDDAGLPVRIAGDVVAGGDTLQGAVRRAWATLELRSAGRGGRGIIDVVSPG